MNMQPEPLNPNLVKKKAIAMGQATKSHLLFLGGWVAILGVLLTLSGCNTSKDAENKSARPWNSSQTWEHGVLAPVYEGR
jgi:hypothetical protein